MNKTRTRRANLGTILVDGKAVRVWYEDGRLRFRALHARKTDTVDLSVVYDHARGQKLLTLAS